jgi:hypothetical protein
MLLLVDFLCGSRDQALTRDAGRDDHFRNGFSQ